MKIDDLDPCCSQTVQERRSDNQHKARTHYNVWLVLQHNGGKILKEGFSGVLATFCGCRVLFLVFDQAANINTQILDRNCNENTNLMYPVGIPAFLALSRPYAFPRLETRNHYLFSPSSLLRLCKEVYVFLPTYSNDVCFWNNSSRASVYDGLKIGPISYKEDEFLTRLAASAVELHTWYQNGDPGERHCWSRSEIAMGVSGLVQRAHFRVGKTEWFNWLKAGRMFNMVARVIPVVKTLANAWLDYLLDPTARLLSFATLEIRL